MKKLYFLLFSILLSSFSFAQDVAVNGDFESWTGGVLDTWTSEPGTTITEETTTVAQGSSAANFEVTTGTQSNTDFRQSISVTAGNTYDVSVQVYQVDALSDVTIYADGFSNVNSDPSLTGQWQTISYQYVASATESVEFGLRFYDNAGFSDSSTIIIDDYQIIETAAPSSCFNLSLGAENFELVNVTTNGEGDVWEFSSGTYSMNGYCGSGCTELVDQWLIFGPLDLTGVTDLAMTFNSTEGFDGTDLLVQYTNSYSGCPDSTTWTTAATISDQGAQNVDLSAASGTTFFVGIQYEDDGTGGYSSWDLSNVILDATVCPTLGTRPTSDCGTCDITLGTESYTCATNTDGDNNDTVTINIPYTGVEASITSVTTTTGGIGGAVAGDDPSTVSDGTIQITGLSEGDAWDITINGGDCDGTTLSGTVPSAQCDPVDLVINEFLADPDGDNTNGDANGDGTRDASEDEFVEIYNTGSSSIDLSGYVLADGASDRHVFPASTILPANSFIVVFGGGTPTGISGIVQTASTGSIGLTNSGDTIILKDDIGTVLISETFGSEGGNNQSLGREPDFSGAFVQHSTITNADPYFSPGAENVGSSLSVVKNDIEGFAIYPNPVNNGEFMMNSLSNMERNVQIYDLLGKQVYAKNVLPNETVKVMNLNSGVYILKVIEEGKTATRKLVIQ